MDSHYNHHVDFKFLAGILLEIAREPSVDHLLQKLVRRALESPQANIVLIWLVEKTPGYAHGVFGAKSGEQQFLCAMAGGVPTDAWEQPVPFPDQLMRIPVGVGPIGKIATSREVCILDQLDTDAHELADMREWVTSQHIRGFAGAPIIYKDEVLGVFGTFNRIHFWEESIPLEESTQWLRMFANHIAGAIANARAFEEIQRLKAQLEQQNAYLREEVVNARAWGDLVGQSAALSQVVSQIDLVAPTDASVLILGETGTGKELIAHEIHRRSERRDKSMVRVNCASIPKDLYESEFFGHVKGAFTGAIKDRAGRFETAEGGTLFLDEIAEVPMELQSKLLRVLQEKHYERVGDDRTRRADVRIIAATNRDLKKEMDSGHFRQDLYYRLNVFPIRIAPLRERKEDIPLLAQHFIQRSINELRCPKPRLTRAGIVRLQGYSWPGNVRELQNVIERAVILARGGLLEFDLPARDASAIPKSHEPYRENPDSPILTDAELRQRERENLLAALLKTNWKIRGPGGAAELLGVKATTLLSRIKVMGLNRPA